MVAEPAGRRNAQVEIQYDIVALGLTGTEIAAIIKAATGLTIDPKNANFLQGLDTTQLEATRKRLSNHIRWRPPRTGY